MFTMCNCALPALPCRHTNESASSRWPYCMVSEAVEHIHAGALGGLYPVQLRLGWPIEPTALAE